jgi:hypothetical protein
MAVAAQTVGELVADGLIVLDHEQVGHRDKSIDGRTWYR